MGSKDDGFIKIMENSPDEDAISKFNDYMMKQWLNNSNIGLYGIVTRNDTGQ